MPFLPRHAAILASACFLCAAAPAGPTLEGDLPGPLADGLLARVLATARDGGAVDVEGLGRPFVLSRNGTPLGAVVPGRSTAAGPEGRAKTCFVAVVRPGGRPGGRLGERLGERSVAIVPVPRPGQPGGMDCHGYTALGVLPSGPGMVRLGILLDMDGPPLTVPVVLAWRDGQAPAVDAVGTAVCGARHAATIADMRRPGCGGPSALDRAFPPP